MNVQLEDLQKAFAEKRYEDLRRYSEDFINENPEVISGYLYLGKAHLKLKDIMSARIAFFNAKRVDPGHLDPLLYLAQIQQTFGDLGSARAYYQSMLSIDPSNETALIGIADLFFVEELYWDAAKAYEVALEKGVKNSGTVVAKCIQSYVNLGDFEGAMSILEKYPAKQFDEAYSLVKRTLLMNLKKDDEVHEETKLLHANLPDKPKYALEWADLLEKDGDTEGAEKIYTKVIEMSFSPEFNEEAYFRRALIRIDSKNTKGALEDMNNAIELSPSANRYAKRAALRLDMEDTQGALEDFGKAIEMDHSFLEGHIQRGHLHTKLKAYDEAIDDFNHLLQISQDHPEAYFGLGMCFYSQGERAKALDFLQRAESFGHRKASKFLISEFPDETARLRENTKQVFAEEFQEEYARNKASTMLQKAFDKLWVPDMDRTITAMGQEVYKYPTKLLKEMLELIAKDMFIITLEGLLFFERKEDPIEAYYKIEAESAHAIVIQLQPTKGGKRNKMRLYENEGGLVVSYPLVDGQEVPPRYFKSAESADFTDDQKTRLAAKVIKTPYLETIEKIISKFRSQKK